MTPASENPGLRLAIPKGRMYDGICSLMADAGIPIQLASRQYRPSIRLNQVEAKLLKPQAIVKMMVHGSRDAGFAGADWVAEFGADVVELLDTGLDPVRIVLAAPKSRDVDWMGRPFVVATELEQITQKWLRDTGHPGNVLRSFGSTEVYPPEDADCIVDVVATGATLEANGLEVVEEIMASTTRLYASKQAMDSPTKRATIEHLVMLLQSVLDARSRVMIEVNVTNDKLEQLVSGLPCMREPTIARLHGDHGFAIKVAAPRTNLPELIANIKRLGGTDIVVSEISQIVA